MTRDTCNKSLLDIPAIPVFFACYALVGCTAGEVDTPIFLLPCSRISDSEDVESESS